MADEVQLPRWEWDEKAGALVPRCPRCDKPLHLTGSKATCLLMGFSHYHERFADVLDETHRRLAEP